VGTVITAFLTGPMVQLAFRVLRFDVKSVKHSYLNDDVKALGKVLRGR